MKRSTKKGFTIVELVIVIAVIAILTAVLIPTFTSIVKKAEESKAMQEARNEYELYLAEIADTAEGTEDFYINNGSYWFEVTDLQFSSAAVTAPDPAPTTDLTAALEGGNTAVAIYAK